MGFLKKLAEYLIIILFPIIGISLVIFRIVQLAVIELRDFTKSLWVNRPASFFDKDGK
jgi:hypothetical protein